MTKKHFWQTASNWGFLMGAALFAMNLIAWGLKLEANHPLFYELLIFIVICPMIILTRKRNAAQAGSEGYGYGRAVAFVLAMMAFAGIVYGVGRFLIINFMGPEYYGSMNEDTVDSVMLVYSQVVPQLLDSMVEMRDTMVRWLSNPFYLIFAGVLDMVAKGGFLGLILCAFIYRKPDIFAENRQKRSDETGTV